jgi:hypothetical protein
MNIKLSLLSIILSFYTMLASAQIIQQKFLGGDIGMTFFSTEISNVDNVRAYVTSYNGSSSGNLTSLMYKKYVSVKSEIFMLRNMIAVSGGIRYSRVNCSIGRESYWSESSNSFYLLYSREGVTTKYLKINELNQKTDYIGIPVEIRLFPYPASFLRLYGKVGAECQVLLQSKTDVVFYNEAMETYQKDVIHILGQEPTTFSFPVYGAIGLRFGRKGNPSVSVEACVFSTYLTDEAIAIVDPLIGGGFQINVQIPLK